MHPSPIEVLAAAIFAIALVHSFSTNFLEGLALRFPRHAGVFHLLGEVEVVFGLWALVLVVCMFALLGREAAVDYVDRRNFTEPLFVFSVMVVAASRPVLQLASRLVDIVARALPMRRAVATYLLALALIPLLGSFITEPAAMTLGALMLSERAFGAAASERLKYATLAVLFVNVSIGGTLTSYAAPPVLMVATHWGWDSRFVLSTFGWRAAMAVIANAAIVTALFARQLRPAEPANEAVADPVVPFGAMLASVLFLIGIVVFAHHPPIFMALLLFFIGYSVAYPRHHDVLVLRQALLVAFFLAGLVVLGGQQSWWLRPLLLAMSPADVFYGAAVLTAFTDNAALTYLGSLVEGLSDEFKISLVAGAVTGGGLTVIANAPNPAGLSILKGRFSSGGVSAGRLLLNALPPTFVAIVAFRWL